MGRCPCWTCWCAAGGCSTAPARPRYLRRRRGLRQAGSPRWAGSTAALGGHRARRHRPLRDARVSSTPTCTPTPRCSTPRSSWRRRSARASPRSCSARTACPSHRPPRPPSGSRYPLLRGGQRRPPRPEFWRSLRSECAESPSLARWTRRGRRRSATATRHIRRAGPGPCCAVFPRRSSRCAPCAPQSRRRSPPARGQRGGASRHVRPHDRAQHGIPGAARHGAVRGARSDRPRPASDELDAMVRAGRRRASTTARSACPAGWTTCPAGSPTSAELAALCAPVAARGLPYVTHMRGYERRGRDRDGRGDRASPRPAGVAVHVSHFHGPGDALARAGRRRHRWRARPDLRHLPVPARAARILAMVALPRWLARRRPRPRPSRRWPTGRPPPGRRRGPTPTCGRGSPWPTCPHPELALGRGPRLVDAAERPAARRPRFWLDLLRATGLAAGRGGRAAAHQRATTPCSALLRHPAHIGGSDGIFVGAHPHPRGWGAFARFLGRHVRERGDWTWQQAVAHLAAHPARRFGLTDRGRSARPGGRPRGARPGRRWPTGPTTHPAGARRRRGRRGGQRRAGAGRRRTDRGATGYAGCALTTAAVPADAGGLADPGRHWLPEWPVPAADSPRSVTASSTAR